MVPKSASLRLFEGFRDLVRFRGVLGNSVVLPLHNPEEAVSYSFRCKCNDYSMPNLQFFGGVAAFWVLWGPGALMEQQTVFRFGSGLGEYSVGAD